MGGRKRVLMMTLLDKGSVALLPKAKPANDRRADRLDFEKL